MVILSVFELLKAQIIFRVSHQQFYHVRHMSRDKPSSVIILSNHIYLKYLKILLKTHIIVLSHQWYIIDEWLR